MLLRPGATTTIRHQLEPNGAGAITEPRPVATAPPQGAPPQAAFGTLSIRVQPADATLLVDGEEWSAPEGDGPILIDLPDGSHEVEVKRDGLASYRRPVQVRAGRTVSLNVSLSR